MKKEILIKDCYGCKILRIEQTEDRDLDISFYQNIFYEKQDGIFKTIKERFKLIFNILLGKEHRLYDLYIFEEDADKVINEVLDIFNSMKR